MSQKPGIPDLEALYRARYGAFVHVASAIAGDEPRGADAVHDAFASAIGSLASFRGEASLETWVWRIVIRAARAQSPREQPTESIPDSATPTAAVADDSGMRSLVASLPERQRLAVFLRYFADLDYRSIAGVLGVEVGTVSATLSAAHAALHRKLEEVRT